MRESRELQLTDEHRRRLRVIAECTGYDPQDMLSILIGELYQEGLEAMGLDDGRTGPNPPSGVLDDELPF